MEQGGARPNPVEVVVPLHVLKGHLPNRQPSMSSSQTDHLCRCIERFDFITMFYKGFCIAAGSATCVQNATTPRNMLQETAPGSAHIRTNGLGEKALGIAVVELN